MSNADWLHLASFSPLVSDEFGDCSESFQHLISARGKSPPVLAHKRLDTAFQCPGASDDLARVRACVASPLQVNDAARLVRERYGWRGYSIEDGMSPNRDKITLVAEMKGITVGTLTIGFDGPEGLHIEQTYPDSVRAARSQGRRLCELTKLALASRTESQTVLSVLFGLAYVIGAAVRDVTDVFIEVNPRHVPFYRRIMGFVVESGERLCKRVRALAVLLRLSVEELQIRLDGIAASAATIPVSLTSVRTIPSDFAVL